jgi:AcrR family transcriptional regulator
VAEQRQIPRSKTRATQATVATRSRKSSALRKAERRHHILVAAREAFAKRGYHQATIDDIVAEAGVARGTYYLYFEDKRAVFSELIDRFSSKITMAIMRIAIDDPTRSVAEQARSNIRAIIGLCLAERAMTKMLIMDTAGIDPAFDRKLATFYDQVVELLEESLRDGQKLGIVADGEPRVLAYLTIGALKELLYQAVALGLTEASAEALTQQIYQFLCSGYLRVGDGGPASPARRGRR